MPPWQLPCYEQHHQERSAPDRGGEGGEGGEGGGREEQGVRGGKVGAGVEHCMGAKCPNVSADGQAVMKHDAMWHFTWTV